MERGRTLPGAGQQGRKRMGRKAVTGQGEGTVDAAVAGLAGP